MNQVSGEQAEMAHQAEADKELPFGARLVEELKRVSHSRDRFNYATLPKLKS